MGNVDWVTVVILWPILFFIFTAIKALISRMIDRHLRKSRQQHLRRRKWHRLAGTMDFLRK